MEEDGWGPSGERGRFQFLDQEVLNASRFVRGGKGSDPGAEHTAALSHANDNWRALFAVAEIAGGNWPDRARTAARSLADSVGHDASSVGEMLLADLHKIFTIKPDGSIEKISSADLTNLLVQMDGRPWGEWKAGKPLSPNGLARQLKMFKIQPNTMRLHDGSILKGYRY